MILVLSDVHVGRKGSHWKEALSLACDPKYEKVIVCGDFFDVWYKPESILTLMLLALSESTKKIVYVLGNHDSGLGGLITKSICPFIAVTGRYTTFIGGKKYIFVHGHEVDPFNSNSSWIGFVLTKLQAAFHWIFKVDLRARISRFITDHRIKGERDKIMAKYRGQADYLVCGHTHCPGRWESDSLVHYNVGDWIESNTYLTIDNHGAPTLSEYKIFE